MAAKRKTIPKKIAEAVLAEAGYRCGVPACHTTLALDLHHMIEVALGGGNIASNLIALCPTCHALYHRGVIPRAAIIEWKQRLVKLNRGTLRDPGQPVFPPGFSWEPEWFHIGENHVIIYDKRLSLNDIAPYNPDYYDSAEYATEVMNSRVVAAPNRSTLAIRVGSFFMPYFHGYDSEDVSNNGQLHVYSHTKSDPMFTSDQKHYVLSLIHI